ncbi:MAG: DUF4186 domain-containing protein [Planctomycetaceae bacterium]|nr:DUF4186 domain-containing protein [Planctomycetaceae bacterium]
MNSDTSRHSCVRILPDHEALQRSAFRQRFHLHESDRRYLAEKTVEAIMLHAEQLIRQRLAPVNPANDGKQTPMRGHPVFIAQHATATCCRGCLQKWYGVPQDREIADPEIQDILAVIRRWLEGEAREELESPPLQGRLFD